MLQSSSIPDELLVSGDMYPSTYMYTSCSSGIHVSGRHVVSCCKRATIVHMQDVRRSSNGCGSAFEVAASMYTSDVGHLTSPLQRPIHQRKSHVRRRTSPMHDVASTALHHRCPIKHNINDETSTKNPSNSLRKHCGYYTTRNTIGI